MLYWLLSHEALQLRIVRSIREARTPLVARTPRAEEPQRDERPYDLRDGVATIRVEGVLTPTPDMMAEVYGEPNTTYSDLRAALGAALADESVREIVWSIDSPGGSVDGLFALLDDIEDARASGKPMRAVADNAHSAAYGIAAAVGRIEATSRVASFGSVGVATSGFIQGGICGEVVDLTNSDAPEKRPNLRTDEGKAVVVKYLDQLASEFMGTIARGRGVSPSAVAEGYGRGASMLAGAALSAGLIDSIASRASTHARTLTYARKPDTVRDRMADPQTPAPSDALPAAQDAQAASHAAPVAAIPVEIDASALALAASERAELEQLRAERAQREATELRGLVTELVALGAETPATAFADGAPVPRLASEGLPALRARVAALRVARPAASAPLQPPASGAGEDGLEDFERRDAAKIKDPDARARFVASRLARKQKAQ